MSSKASLERLEQLRSCGISTGCVLHEEEVELAVVVLGSVPPLPLTTSEALPLYCLHLRLLSCEIQMIMQ